MTHTASETALIEIAKEYFRRVDAGGASLTDLFTDDVELYFPKFGVAKGMDAFGALASGLFTRISRISHDMDSLLCVANGEDITMGTPFVSGATVTAKVVGHGRGEKLRIFKMRRRKHYRKTQGHRQNYTELEIVGITA